MTAPGPQLAVVVLVPKLAATVVLAVRLTVQSPVPEQPPPDHPLKT